MGVEGRGESGRQGWEGGGRGRGGREEGGSRERVRREEAERGRGGRATREGEEPIHQDLLEYVSRHGGTNHISKNAKMLSGLSCT